MARRSTANGADGVYYNDRVITLKNVFDKSDTTLTTLPCPDKDGVLPKCVKRVTASGDMILSEKERNDFAEGKVMFYPETHIFTIHHNQMFHLDDMREAAMWEAIRHCPFIAKSRDERDENGNLVIDGPRFDKHKLNKSGAASWYIDRPGLDTHRKVAKKELVHKAEAYIIDDPRGTDGRLRVARVLGRDMRNQPDADVKDFLFEAAKSDPKKIIDLYTGTTMSLRLTLMDARDKNVIYVKNKLFMYGDSVVLGATDDAVIGWMQDPKNLKVLELIRKDTYPEY